MIKDTGGPAYPCPIQHDDWREDYQGMTLRDYFAGKAMQGMLANKWNQNYDSWAQHAYMMADAMITERAKQ
jgi:hypothetical protein